MNRSLTMKNRDRAPYSDMKPLLERIEKGEIDPSFVITHTMRLDDAPRGYSTFLNKEDDCIEVVPKI